MPVILRKALLALLAFLTSNCTFMTYQRARGLDNPRVWMAIGEVSREKAVLCWVPRVEGFWVEAFSGAYTPDYECRELEIAPLDPQCEAFSFHVVSSAGERSLERAPDYVLIAPVNRIPAQQLTRLDSACEVVVTYGRMMDRNSGGITVLTDSGVVAEIETNPGEPALLLLLLVTFALDVAGTAVIAGVLLLTVALSSGAAGM